MVSDPNGRAIASVLTLEDALPSGQDDKRAIIARLVEQIDRVPEQRRSEELRALDDVLTLYDVRLTNRSPGVELSNLGVVGATIRDLAARDQQVVARELAAWRPAFSKASISPCNTALPCCTLRLCPLPIITPL